jgi:hypothetical protein
MSTKNILAAAAVALGLSAGYAFAGEGNGDPFAFQGDHQISNGRAFVVDTGSDAYPQMTGNTAQPAWFKTGSHVELGWRCEEG